MKKMMLAALIVAGLMTNSAAGSVAPLGYEEVSVLRTGREALVRTKFSETRDMVVCIQRGVNEYAYLVERTSATADYRRGTLVHSGGDDFTPVHVRGVDAIGGNHGSNLGQLQTLPNHGFGAAMLGLAVTNAERAVQRIIAIPDKDHLLLHSVSRKGSRLSFFCSDKGPFCGGGKSWMPEGVKHVQVHPVNRFTRFRWQLPDGREVPEGEETRAADVTLAMEQDVLDPRGLVEHFERRPGLSLDPVPQVGRRFFFPDEPVRDEAGRAAFLALPALVHVSGDYVYRPGCARLVRRKVKFPQPLESCGCHDVMYCWQSNLWKDVSFYIPRTKPVLLKGTRGGPDVTVDLQAVAPMTETWNVSSYLMPSDWTDPDDPPDRFIRLMDNGRDKVGVVLGYSRVAGASAVGRPLRPRPYAYFFYRTGKMYPHDYTLKDVKAGDEIETWSYTQYFDRTREPDATAFFQHREGDDEIVYFDCHKTLSGKKLDVGRRQSGRCIEVVEKTPSVTLRTADRVAADGTVTVDVAGGYGTLVLKLKGAKE